MWETVKMTLPQLLARLPAIWKSSDVEE